MSDDLRARVQAAFTYNWQLDAMKFPLEEREEAEVIWKEIAMHMYLRRQHLRLVSGS